MDPSSLQGKSFVQLLPKTDNDQTIDVLPISELDAVIHSTNPKAN